MYALLALILGLACLWLSRRIFGTIVAPLGVYGAVWMAMLLLHWFVGLGNSGIFYDLVDRTLYIIFIAWGVWIAGCLLGMFSIKALRPRPLTENAAFDRNLRTCLVVLIAIALPATLFNLYRLQSSGALFQTGDAWRETHFVSSREIYGRMGALLDLATPFSIGGFYAAFIIGLYAVVRRNFSAHWVLVPGILGVAHDITAVGRFWITQVPVLAVVAWLVYSRLPSLSPRPGGPHRPPSAGRVVWRPRAMQHPSEATANSPERAQAKSKMRTMMVLAAFMIIAMGGLKTISLMRDTLRSGSESGVNVGNIRVHGALVSPIIYAASSLALFNYYADYGFTWDQTNGKIAAGGAVYLTSPVTRVFFGVDLGKEVVAYNDSTNEPRPVGPYKSTVFFATYLLPALSDFSDWGVVIYPLCIAFLTTQIFRRALVETSLFPVFLYPLAAVWVAMSVMRWELMNSAHWPAMLYLWGASLWVGRSLR